MGDRKPPALRLAFRAEGEFWNAYVAEPGTMQGAFLLGSIRLATVPHGSKRKAAFMDLMRAALAAALKDMGSTVSGWNDPVVAPPHERAGRA